MAVNIHKLNILMHALLLDLCGMSIFEREYVLNNPLWSCIINIIIFAFLIVIMHALW